MCWEGVSREQQRGKVMFKHVMSSDIQQVRDFCLVFRLSSSISIALNTDTRLFLEELGE